MSRLLLGIAAALLAFTMTQGAAQAQLYQRFVPVYGNNYNQGYNQGYNQAYNGFGNNHTHYHAVPHGNHVDLVPHASYHHGHTNHYSPYRSSFSFGYSSGYGGYGSNFYGGYNNGGHCYSR